MHVSAAHQGSEPVVNQEESNGKLPPCVHCQESDNGSLSSPRVVLDLMYFHFQINALRQFNESDLAFNLATHVVTKHVYITYFRVKNSS